jgi:hypothetical protein
MNTLKSALKKVLPRSVIDSARYLKSFWDRRNDARYWRNRIDEVIACPDNQFIPRVPDAGKLVDGQVVMHNGIKVGGMGYYGAGILNMLIENRGVHEPQEERAFAAVLRHLPSGSTMLELGAYWAYYSLWFSKSVPDARCYLVEPMIENLRSGQSNFEFNNARGNFTQAFVGSEDRTDRRGKVTIAVDPFCQRQGIDHLAILHADIQGGEADMLRGAKGMLGRKAADWVFISTHSNALHRECQDILRSHGYIIMASADLDETYSSDGLIVAKAHAGLLPAALLISKKRGSQSLPPSVRCDGSH